MQNYYDGTRNTRGDLRCQVFLLRESFFWEERADCPALRGLLIARSDGVGLDAIRPAESARAQPEHPLQQTFAGLPTVLGQALTMLPSGLTSKTEDTAGWAAAVPNRWC